MHDAALRERHSALDAFFRAPPPRSFDAASPAVRAYYDEYVGSADLARRIVQAIVMVPWLIFAVERAISALRGTVLGGEAFGQVLGSGIGLGLFFVLPLRLFFRSMRRRNQRRLEGYAKGSARDCAVARAEEIMHSAGDGPKQPAWQVWLSLDGRGRGRVLRLVWPRTPGQSPPREHLVVEAPSGDCFVLCDISPHHQMVAEGARLDALPPGARPPA